MSRKTSPPSLEGCKFVEFLGEGGFADVYKYEQFGRFVAVKVLHNSLGSDNQRAFEAEARTMGKLSEHPNVVSIYGAGRTSTGSAYLIMEYCPPPNLAVRIRQNREPYAVAKTLQTGIQIAGAVESAHRLHILHRDIKPANILITAYGRPALTDFGIASALDDHSARAEGVSVPWAPPEQLSAGTPLTPSADVYALAATLWTLLAGRSPFERLGGPNDSLALSKRIRSEPPPRVGRRDVPESLERVLQTALAKQVEARYPTAEAFARALQGIEAELHLPQTTFEAIQVLGPGGATPEPEQRSGTRVVGFVSIDPDLHPNPNETPWPAARPESTRTRPGDVPGEGRSIAPDPGTIRHVPVERAFASPHVPSPDLAETVARPGVAGSGDRPDPRHAPEHVTRDVVVESPGRRVGAGIVVSAAAVGLLALAVVATPLRSWLGSGAEASSSSATSSAMPADPLKDAAPSPVTSLRLDRKGPLAVAAWSGPRLKAGEAFLFAFYRPETGPDKWAPTTKTSATAKLDGDVCVAVKVIGASGKSSEPEKDCT